MSAAGYKLFRHGPPGAELPGLMHAGNYYDLGALVGDFDEAFFTDGGMAEVAALVESERLAECAQLEEGSFRFASVVARPSKILGIGLNYRDHAAETGGKVPSDPKIFMKATTALCGCADELVLPRGSTHTDYEVELALVIGKRCKDVPEGDALAHVAGYTICNDYSERDWQKNRHGQFVKGKSADTFCPLGPFLVPAEQLDASDLRLWLSVNGEMRQDGRTSQLIFGISRIIASLSEYMTLLPGDVITTGTPAGVGLGRTPPEFLKPGDSLRYGIVGIGETEQRVIASPAAR